MDLMSAINVSAGGMQAQSLRMKIVSENIANADSIQTPEGGAYRRKMVHFKTEVDRATGMSKVVVDKVGRDMNTPLKASYEPSSPYANEQGVVYYPNVDTSLESVDMRDAARLYEANMAAIDSAKQMMSRSLNMLK